MSELNSHLYVGKVRHRRFTPISHQLDYPIFMPAIDLDEIDELEKKIWGFGTRWWHWARWRREDYMTEGDLKAIVQQEAFRLSGIKADGKVIALCHLRYLGLYFSPVNFYYLFDKQGEWKCILAEVSNTPWNERHLYVVNADKNDDTKAPWQHQKQFHVSPFNPIDMEYKWRISELKKSANIHLECHKQGKHFDATLAMKQQAFASKTLLKQLIKTPIQTISIVTGIYWHALKLWVKGAPFYSHPESSHPEPSKGEYKEAQTESKTQQPTQLRSKNAESTVGEME